MSDYEDIVESLVEVELPDSDAFLKVKETRWVSPGAGIMKISGAPPPHTH